MVAIAAVAAGAIVLFAIPLALVLQRSYRDEELVRLQRDTVAATRSVDLPLPTGDRLELPPFSGQLTIYSAAGRRLAGAGPAAADATAAGALRRHTPTATAAAGELVVAVPLFVGERFTGVVRGRRADGVVASRTHRAWLLIAALGVGVLVLALLAGLALSRRLARPLEALAGVAGRMGGGDFAARASPSALPEVDAVAAALNHGAAQIGELVAREREFSANASHQLRTPLAALRLELEAAELTAPASRPEFTAALAQVDRLEATIATLLEHARRPEPASTGAVDLLSAMDELEARWRGRLAASGRPLRVSVQARPAMAAIGPPVLDEIVDILLQNAVDHGAGAVTVTVREAGDTLALEVSDQGDGFAAEPEILFARGVGSGAGIGLALARSLAHSAGAMLQVTRARPRPQLTLLIPRVARGSAGGR